MAMIVTTGIQRRRFLGSLISLMAMMGTMVNAFSMSPSTSHSALTSLSMVRTRGLERTAESATPEEGGMTLFLKAGPSPDGTKLPVGDCPFAHAVRLVLEEKGLSYQIQPCSPDTKPEWLLDYYEGKMPALRHRKECYVESSVIMEYLEFFFSSKSYPALKPPKKCNGEEVLDGFFPAVAQYLKDTTDDDEKLENLRNKLQGIEDHLSESHGSFMCGDDFSLFDCRLVPQLYHLNVASQEFKDGIPKWGEDYPQLQAYYESCTSRPSFQTTLYPEETIVWGWGQARS